MGPTNTSHAPDPEGARQRSDDALNFVDQNLAAIPRSSEDRRLKATILATRPARRSEAIKILESLASGGELDRTGRFLLAELYLGEGREDAYRRR